MKVEFYGRCKQGYGNICWSPAYEMRGGKFPSRHPCAGNPKPTVFSRESQPETDDALGKFRALGYLASCFPEGDGIAFDPPDGKAPEQVPVDVRACFGFDVEVKRL